MQFGNNRLVSKILRLLMAALVFFVLLLPAQAKSLKPVKDVETENEVIKLYNQALKYSKEERNVHARVLLEKAATYDPTSVSAFIHAALSEIYHDLGNPDRAIKEAQTALNFDRSMKNMYYNLGLYCKDANRYDDGIAYLTKFVETASGDKKINALSLIDSLRNEQSKMGAFSNNDPDYLGQLMAEGSAHSWAASRVPLKVFIERTSSARGFLPGFPQIARNAFITWYQASGKKLAFTFVETVGDSDINVEWTDGMLKVGDEKYERTKAGLTTTTRREAGIEHARIQIRTVRAFSKEAEPEDRIKETCLHEIGHALGLNGHSSNTADIMYFGNTARQLPALTKRDKATMARLYQSYPCYPMDGVDTTFAYPPPATDIPRLGASDASDTTGGASSDNSESDTASADKTNQLLPMPDLNDETALPGIVYTAPGGSSANQPAVPSTQPVYQQSTYQPPSYQQPSYQRPPYQPAQPSYPQANYQQQPFPQQSPQAWQSAPAPYYPPNTYPASSSPNPVPYAMPPQNNSFSAQPQMPQQPNYGQAPYGGQSYGAANSVGPEQTPASGAQTNPIMQFAQQFMPQNGQPGQPNAIMQGLQPMVNQVIKMFQPQTPTTP